MIQVTIGIICHNEVENIDSCLAEILSQRNLSHIHEIIIVDNASSDGTHERLNNWTTKHPGLIRIFRSEQNLIGLARQIIVDQCSSELLLFTDADCLVPNDWIAQHLYNLAQTDEHTAGVCGPNRLPEFHNWQIALNHFMSTPIGHGGSPQAMIPSKAVSVDHLPTTNALFRVSAIRKTRGFKAHLMVGEDAELGKQLTKAGFKMIMFPSPLVINYSAKSFKEWCARMLRFGGAQWIHSPLRSMMLFLFFPLSLIALVSATLIISLFVLLSVRANPRMALLSAGYGVISLWFYSFGILVGLSRGLIDYSTKPHKHST